MLMVSAARLMLALTVGTQISPQNPVAHPLDPLTTTEHEAVLALLRDEAYLGAGGLYPLITLDEPPKEQVLAWTPGMTVQRRAFVIGRKGFQVFEAAVDLVGGRVISWQEIPGVESSVLPTEEWFLADRLVRRDSAWQAAIRARGVSALRDVVCVPHTAGYFGTAEETGRRLVKVLCYDSGDTRNYWGRPIEGVIATVDLRSRDVTVTDLGPVPVPRGPVDLDPPSVGRQREPPRPISIAQPEGTSIIVDGRVVTWQKWRFHFRIDPRVGPVISTVRYHDNGSWRSVLYQGSLSELFVPYMDPDAAWYFKTYLDAGEFGVGKLGVELQPEVDCPPGATFFGAVFADDWGDPYTKERVSCLFERYAGDMAWRHYEGHTEQTEVRRRTDLVLRFISAVGNYDYVFDWIFRQDGSIRVRVGSTGVMQVKAVTSETMRDGEAPRDTRYGRMVAEHTVAVNHDHYFNFRIDFDVDGAQNSFVYEPLQGVALSDTSLRKSVWVVESQTAATERDAKLRIDLEQPALWRVVNPSVLGPLGYPVSYQLKPETNAISLLTPEDFPRRRAGFTDFHLWVTPYARTERFAAGAYPNQSKGADGLPRWTSADRPIEHTDIVLWYSMGLHHVGRAEDWPVLPTVWSGFELRPFDFFTRNPALDIPNHR